MAQLNEYTYLSQVTSLLLIIIIYYIIIKGYILPKIIQRYKVSNTLSESEYILPYVLNQSERLIWKTGKDKTITYIL
jgi:hypothetical protein